MSVRRRKHRVRYVRLVIGLVLIVWGATHTGHASAAVHSLRPHVRQSHIARAADPTAGHVLGGMTRQHWPVIMTVAPTGKQFTAEIALDMHCTSGDTWTAPDGWFGVAIPASGSINVEQAIPSIPGSGTQDSITGGLHTLKGKLNRKRATFSGVWELKLNFASSTGQTDSCDSGPVSFSVRL